jgi:hypothetical protein
MTQKFGKLSPLSPVGPEQFGSHKKVLCRCDCGREKEISIRKMVSHHTSTCGRCNEISESEMSIRRFGKLRIQNPVNIKPGSNRLVEWVCDCGNVVKRSPNTVISGKTGSCGACNLIQKDAVSKMTFGKLRIAEPQDVNPGSAKKILWNCECGNQVLAHIKSVVRGLRKSCSKCNRIKAQDLATKTFGRLQIVNPIDLTTGSTANVEWKCRCGNITRTTAHRVLRSHTTSCGRCSERIQDLYKQNRQAIRSLKTPIRPDQIPWDFIRPLQVIEKVSPFFRALCPICDREYGPRWDAIRLGHGLTCGCVTSRVSSGQTEIIEFLKNITEVVPEFKIGRHVYDILIPGAQLLVEYNGLYWHSRPDSKKRDIAKYKNAIRNGYRFISIMEDEWANKKQVFHNLLKNRIRKSNSRSIRLNRCQIRAIQYKEASAFLNQYHYLGSARARFYYGCYSGDRLLAVMTISTPTRLSRYQYEITRQASHPEFRVHGVWSKMFRVFLGEHSPDSVVTFSDNRLFGGEVYRSMGFMESGSVPPDYWWTRGRKRFNKSGLRKPEGETKTENQLRTEQGYSKIWDLGKKRWVYNKV